MGCVGISGGYHWVNWDEIGDDMGSIRGVKIEICTLKIYYPLSLWTRHLQKLT